MFNAELIEKKQPGSAASMKTRRAHLSACPGTWLLKCRLYPRCPITRSSLWPWQTAIKGGVPRPGWISSASYDREVHSPSLDMKDPER